MLPALYILVGLYFIVWAVFAVMILKDGDPGNVNPLSLWTKNARLVWRLLWINFKVHRVKVRNAQKKSRDEILAEIKKGQDEYAKWAFKDPHSFLGVERNTNIEGQKS